MLIALIALVGITTLAAGFQLWLLRSMGPRRPVGDENAYLTGKDMFIRPPLLHALAGLIRRGRADAVEARLRAVMALASVVTVAVVGATGWLAGGAELGLVSAVIMAAQPERMILACHIWPDTWLALIVALIALVWASSFGGAPAATAVGLLAAVAVAARIDALIIVLALVSGWGGRGEPLTAVTAAAILAPSLLLVVALSLWNHRRAGVALPDTTWAFNVMAMTAGLEAERDDHGLERRIGRVARRWHELDAAGRLRSGRAGLLAPLRAPGRALTAILQRTLAMLGPDTFVRQKLLPADMAYPALSPRLRARWQRPLKWVFPATAATVIVGALAGSGMGELAWPALALLAVACLVHARTRYRLTIMPIASLLAARALLDLLDLWETRPIDATTAIVATAVLAWALSYTRAGTEIAPSAGR